MSISSSKHKKYFSLIDKSYFPSLLNQNDSKDYIKATLSLVKKNKFIYLDMNATNGFKAMEQNQSPQSDQEDQNFGPYVVCQGTKTSRQKIKLKQFMTINNKIRQKRNMMRSRVKQQLDRSKQKYVTLRDELQRSKEKIKLFRGLDNEKFQTIKDNLQTQQINADILKKQQKIMQKLGIVADFQSIGQRNTSSYVDKSKKAQTYFLPRILRSYNN